MIRFTFAVSLLMVSISKFTYVGWKSIPVISKMRSNSVFRLQNLLFCIDCQT
jgi:hypothetical protein